MLTICLMKKGGREARDDGREEGKKTREKDIASLTRVYI
jgi:hypothetical protein